MKDLNSTLKFWMSPSMFSPSNCCMQTIFPPRLRNWAMTTTMPKMWKKGRSPRTVPRKGWDLKVSCKSMHSCDTMFWCVSMTPFGKPVVPLEYGIAHTSSFGFTGTLSGKAEPSSSNSASKGSQPSASPITKTSFTPFSAAAIFALSAIAGTVRMYFAPESFSWYEISFSVKVGFNVVTIPPREMTPKNTMGNSGTLGRYRANMSPFLKPLFVNADPNFFIEVLSSL